MALISGNTIIRSLALFHITIGFFFLTSPKTVADQSLVFVLGEAMKLPHARAFDVQSAPLAFLAAVLIIFGISDLVSVSMPAEVARYHWGTQAPVRLALFFALTIYAFLFSASSPIFASSNYAPSRWGEGLKNRVVFTWAFLEVMTWFWVFVTLREERREAAVATAKKQAARDEI